MIRKLCFASVLMVGMGTSSAFAACSHNGISYAVGSVLCFGGWLQECTVANYWKAIGSCKASDPLPGQVRDTDAIVDRMIALVDRTGREARIPAEERK